MKRLFDIGVAAIGLIVLLPFLAPALFIVWYQDRHSPLYRGRRAGRRGPFMMLKIRSMHVNADKSGVTATATDDNRITPAGAVLRRYKIDEFPQLWNVLTGEMSLVGPRPVTIERAATFTEDERRLLTVRPGITDFSSIVFSDEADILKGVADPDAIEDAVIRPWISRLSLFYVDHHSVPIDVALICLTLVNIVSRENTLRLLGVLLKKLDADDDLIAFARRNTPFVLGGVAELASQI